MRGLSQLLMELLVGCSAPGNIVSSDFDVFGIIIGGPDVVGIEANEHLEYTVRDMSLNKKYHNCTR